MNKSTWGMAAGLAVLAAVVLGRVAGYGFVEFDDDIYVTANPSIRLGLSAAGVKWAFTTLYAAFWHPLTWLSLLADYEWFGMDGRFFHLTNLLLHLANTILLFVLLRRLTGGYWRSGLVAALFAVHPLHVESVAWIAERKDVLSTCLGLLAMLAYGKYGSARKAGWYAASLALFTLSLMAKPMLVTLPALLLILDAWPLRRPDPWARLALEKAPFLLLSAAFSAVAVAAQRASGAMPLDPGPLWFRLVTAVHAAGWYLAKMVWPTNLAPFYPWRPGWPALPVAASAVVVAGVTFLACRRWRDRPWLLVGWLWFGVTLLPVSGLVRVGSHAWADRYTYLPLVGVWMAIVWEAGAWIRRRPSLLRPLSVAAVLAVAACSVAAWRQAGYWSDTEFLFKRTLAVTGENPMIESNLSAVLFRKGKVEEALLHARRAVALNPESASAHNNLGVVLGAKGALSEAITHYGQAVALKDGNYAEALSNLGAALLQAGLAEAALDPLRRAVELKPADDKSLSNLGSACFLLGRTTEAGVWYEKAMAASPGSATAAFNLGAVRERQGRYAEAARLFERAAILKPGDPEALQRMREARRKAAEG